MITLPLYTIKSILFKYALVIRFFFYNRNIVNNHILIFLLLPFMMKFKFSITSQKDFIEWKNNELDLNTIEDVLIFMSVYDMQA